MFRKAVLTLAVAMIPVVALAQHPQSKSGTTRFYNQQGRPQGHSTSQGGTTRFYNQQGRPQGHSVQRGNTTRFYSQQGRPQGRIVRPR
jgi:YD repeat-containing protein